ncbi:MAG: iron-sulfur cluster assembly scaffold protein [Pseudomonadota bacterium]
MSNDTDLVKLYSGRILALAADIPHLGRLDHPTGSAKRRSPQCGSTVTVDLCVEDGRITAIGQDVRACALGQAAASVLGRGAIGSTRDEIDAARDALASMLKADGAPPVAPFAELETLLPARAFPNRHASILLAFEAAAEALEQAERAA